MGKLTVIEIAARQEAREVPLRDYYSWHTYPGFGPLEHDGDEPRFVATREVRRVDAPVQELRHSDGRNVYVAVHPEVFELVEAVSPRMHELQAWQTKARAHAERQRIQVECLNGRIATFQALPWPKRLWRALKGDL
jgi:hypothetical protein